MSMEVRGELIKINCLPSCTRICLNVILIPKAGSCKAIKSDKKLTLEILRNKETDNKEMIKHHFVHKEGFVFGSCQVSLFDENFLIRQGGRELRLWPFEMFNPRMVCQGECFSKDEDEIGTTKKTNNFKPERINQTMSLQIEFQSFAGKVGWRLQRPDPS